MECFAICGWWRAAVSKAPTDVKDMLKVVSGKFVEDPPLKTF